MVQHDRYPERDPMSASSGLGSEADVERVTEVVLLVPKALIQMIARNRARSLASIRLWFIQNLIQERAEVFAVLVQVARLLEVPRQQIVAMGQELNAQ
jgi:hypothetical protein